MAYEHVVADNLVQPRVVGGQHRHDAHVRTLRGR